MEGLWETPVDRDGHRHHHLRVYVICRGKERNEKEREGNYTCTSFDLRNEDKLSLIWPKISISVSLWLKHDYQENANIIISLWLKIMIIKNTLLCYLGQTNIRVTEPHCKLGKYKLILIKKTDLRNTMENTCGLWAQTKQRPAASWTSLGDEMPRDEYAT